jgi:pilus assembly protein CpaC
MEKLIRKFPPQDLRRNSGVFWRTHLRRKMRKLIFGLFCTAVFIMVLPFRGYSAGTGEEELKLYVGQPQTISINSPKKVAIGNPAIADIASVTKTELTISPKAPGSTNLMVWDVYGEQAYLLRVYAEDTNDLKRRIDSILSTLDLPDVYSKAEDEEDRVSLLGSVKLLKDKERLALALVPLKKNIVDLTTVREEEAVIDIDVQVIELDSGYRNTLGFTWPSSINLTEVGSAAITGGVHPFSLAKLFTVADMTRDAFTLKLDALVQEGKARVLSRPRLSCQSGKEAKLVVGGEVPILSGTSTPSSTTPGAVGATTSGSVEYKEYGIILKIKPQLADSTGRIRLDLDMTVSEVGDAVETTFALAYKLTKRSATTEVFLDNNQTMAIGGLIKKKSTEELKRVPWLSDVPVLGLFFRQRTTTSGSSTSSTDAEDTELFIILTPSIVTPPGAPKPDVEIKPRHANIRAPAVGDDKIKDPVLKYSKLVQKKIIDNLAYPAAAKDAGFQGAVKLSLKLSPQGDLLDAKIKETSSYQVLDDAALKTAQAISPYPPFLPQIKAKEIWVDIPIVYQLE